MGKQITVLIVDDHALVRMGIHRLLDDLPDVIVVGEAKSGEEALTMVKSLMPHVVLLDIKLPGIDGWEVTRRIKRSNPSSKIIAVTALSTDPLPLRLLQLGAMGYLTKESSPEEMAIAIRKVAKGEKYLGAEIAQKIAINSLQMVKGSPFDTLSEREMQITLMITAGMNIDDISERLFLSTKTIHGHRYRILEKLNIKNDVELIYLAMKHHVVEQPQDDLVRDE